MHVCLCVYMCTYLLLVPRIAFNKTVSGKSESLKDKLRSILAQSATVCHSLAQSAFKDCLNQWCEKGVDFTTYLYVPKQVFFEREDEAHVLKVHVHV